MKIHESAENYLETIYRLSQRNDIVRSIDIANELQFSKPSVSVAMKNFRENNLVEMDSHGHITLTATGLQIAKNTYERHEVLTAFFVGLGVSEKIADEDACRVEHVISPELFDAIKAQLQK